jgi:hypothetical protein
VNQAAEEWDDMNEKTQSEIADRLHTVIADAERADYRARLARASRSHYPQAADRG